MVGAPSVSSRREHAVLRRALCQITRDRITTCHRPQPTVLIDDLYDRLVEYFPTLETEEQRLLTQYLVLGAYGAPHASSGQQAPLHLIPLPTWEDTERFIATLDKHLIRRYGKEVSYGR